MRIGTNPEKDKYNEINYKDHRVIIPVYVPYSKENYYKNLFEVFKFSILSLLKSINNQQTNITIINNNSNAEVTNYIDNLLSDKKIDKHVKLSSNYGKVFTILSEAKSSFENFITIADADVFFYKDWFKESLKIFNNFSNVGVVSPLPMPQLAFYTNNSLFCKEFLSIQKDNIVAAKDLHLFEESVNGKIIIKNHDWFKKQFYLSKNNTKACIGSGHFIATYRKEIFNKLNIKKPIYVFNNGAEGEYLDLPIDKLGYYRCSTIKTYAYHLGNDIPKWVKSYQFEQENAIFDIDKTSFKKSILPYFIKTKITSFYRRVNKF